MTQSNFGLSDTVPIGSLVNARFKGNFHDATVIDIEKKLKCKVGYIKNGDYTVVSVDSRFIDGSIVMDEKVTCEIDGQRTIATIKGIVDVSTYKLDFYDGDVGYAKRRQILVKKLPNNKIEDSFDVDINEMKDSTVDNNMNRSFDENSIVIPGKRNTFNSLLSSLDSMDPKDSSVIMNVIEMSFNESKNSSVRSRSHSSTKSSNTQHNALFNKNDSNKQTIKKQDKEKAQKFSSTSDISNHAESSSYDNSNESIEELVDRKLCNSVLLEYLVNAHIDDVVEILHIEFFNKLNGCSFIKYPTIKDEHVDIYRLLQSVTNLGGSESVSEKKQWRDIAEDLKLQNAVPATFCCLKRFFNRWLLPYVIHRDSTLQKKCCIYISKIKKYFEYNNHHDNKIIDLTQYKLKNHTSGLMSHRNRSLSRSKSPKNDPDEIKMDSRKNKTDSYYSKAKKNNNTNTPYGRRMKRSETLQSSSDFSDDTTESTDDEDYNRNYMNGQSNINYTIKKEIPTAVFESVEVGEHSLKVGSLVMVKYGKSTSHDFYPAKITNIRRIHNNYTYFVHYKGWNSRYDEWVKLNRIQIKNLPKDESSTNTSEKPETPVTTSNPNKILPDNLSVPSRSGDITTQKRPKGRPPTKHLHQNTDKLKISSNKTNAHELTGLNSNDKHSLSIVSDELSDELNSKNSSSKHTIHKINSSKSPVSTVSLSKNKTENDNKSSSIMIPNFSGNHRRTRNSLQDAILDAVIKQSVLETQHNVISQNDSDTNKKNEKIVPTVSSYKSDAYSIDEFMGSIIGQSNNHSEIESEPLTKSTGSNHSSQSSGKSGAVTVRSTTSNRGRRPKTNSRKTSPSYSTQSINEIGINSQRGNTASNMDYSSNRDDKKSYKSYKNKPKGVIVNSTSNNNHNNKSNKSSINHYDVTPPSSDNVPSKSNMKNGPHHKRQLSQSLLNKMSDIGESSRKRSAYNFNEDSDDQIETEQPPSSSKLTHANFKQSKQYRDNNVIDTSPDRSNTITPISTHNNETHSNNKNISRSTISFTSKIKNLVDNLVKKNKNLEANFTSIPSIDNIKKIENLLSEIQQAHSKVKQKLRKLERGRKRYLQNNS